MANNEILQIVVFSLVFWCCYSRHRRKGPNSCKAMDAIAHVIMKITGYVMKLAPFAVFGAITAVVAKQGLRRTFNLWHFYRRVLFFAVCTLVGYHIGRLHCIKETRFSGSVNSIKDAMLIAFGTSTSEAAYPKVLEELERFGCSNKIVSFVLPLGLFI
jgi:Na+/H+-dicarboxylate symporter